MVQWPLSRVFLLALLAAATAHAAEPVPITMSAGPVTVRPSGFFQPLAMFRSETTGDTVNTRFGRIPLTDTPSEALFSVAHSRLMLHGETPIGIGKFLGYLETDFLNPPGERPFRFRQYWGQVQHGKWKLLGGQAWSLLRPNRVGIASDKDLMNTHVVEPNYHVGLMGVRRRQVRLTRDMGAWNAAVAYESGGRVTMKVAHDGARARLEAAGLTGTRGRKGVSLAGVVHATSRVNIVSQQFWSQGGGPEALGLLPAGVHAHATVQGAEVQVRPSLEIFGYGGIVYGARSVSNRTVRQWTTGARQKLYSDPYFGSLFFAFQYSQLDRSVWAGGQGAMSYAQLSLWYHLPATR